MAKVINTLLDSDGVVSVILSEMRRAGWLETRLDLRDSRREVI